MSTDFNAVFDAGRCEGLEWLASKLDGMPAFIHGLEEYRPLWRPQAWAIEQLSPRMGRDVVGPCGFSIGVAEGTLKLYHTMRFSTFTGDSVCRQALRRSCLMLADLVGSSHAIYTHELMPHEGTSVSSVAAWLEREIGPCAATFEQLRDAEYFGPRAWYIDSFADLR